MVPLLLFHLVSLFVSRTSSGVVPQNFKHNDPSHLEAIFTNNGTNASNLTLENSELHNDSSSVLVDLEGADASHISNTDLHDISDLDHVTNNIPEESHTDKKIPTGSGRSKKKVSKDSNKKRESFNKNFRGESGHEDTDHVKPIASIEDHSSDVHHSDNNDSKRLDDIEHVTNNHFDDGSHHSVNLTIESDPSKMFDHDVNKELNTSVLDDENHLEDVKIDLNHFNPDHLNNSVLDPSNNVSNSFDHGVNKEFNTSVLDDGNHLEDVTSDLNHLNNPIVDPLNVSNSFDHSVIKEFNTNDENHLEDITSDMNHLNNPIVDPLNNASDSFDHRVNKELNNSVLDDGNHLENVTTDSKHFNPEHLNKSVVELKKPLNEVTKNVSKELNSTLEDTLELNNHSQIISDAPKTFERQKDHFDHMENSPNTSIQLNKAAVNLSNSSKLFLNIHNSFMRLNPTDKPKSPLLNHHDKISSENAKSIHERTDTVKKDEESFEKSSETEDNLEGFNTSEIQTDIPSNITKEMDPINISVLDTKDNGFGHETNADIVTAVPKEPIVVTEGNETQGLFSTLGLDFLMNSELAKNAASAMEVFNFSDSALTDHIVDDKNDMHDFLDFIPLVHHDNQSKSDHTPSTSSTLDPESSTFDTDSSTLFDNEEKTFLNPVIENEIDPTSHSLDVPSSENNSSEVLTTTLPSPILNSTVEFEVTTLPSQTIFNSTVEYEVITIPSQLMLNSTVEYEITTKIPPPVTRNGTEIASEAKCPPPGFCIFWFLGQDTCTVNSHCLGSRICCRIGCTKTCVEV